MHPTEQAARDILATIEAHFPPTHRYVTANAADYRHLDLGFYDRTARLLERHGFRLLADVEDRTITEAPGTVLSAILVRTMVSADGSTLVALYHPHLRSVWLRMLLWLLRKLPGKVTDVETECSDGTFVVTSNAASAAAIQSPPLIANEYLAAGTAPLEVVARHAERLAAHLAARPGVTPRVVTTHEEMVASQNRMNALTAAYRGEIGGISREELEQLSTFGTALAHDVHADIVREQVRRAG